MGLADEFVEASMIPRPGFHAVSEEHQRALDEMWHLEQAHGFKLSRRIRFHMFARTCKRRIKDAWHVLIGKSRAWPISDLPDSF